MSKPIAEPPKGSLFTFKQYGCKCNIEKRYEDDETESYWIQIISDENFEIELYHDFKNGLYKSDAIGDKSKDIVHEIPYSDNIKNLNSYFSDGDDRCFKPFFKTSKCDEESYAKEVKSFFERYGFLFPLTNRVSLFSVKEIGAFLDRLFIVAQLISEIKNNRKQFGYDYNKIFSYVFILALSNDRSIADWKNEGNIIYTIPKHPTAKTLDDVPEKHNRPVKRIYRHQNKVTHYELLIKAFDEFDEQLKEKGIYKEQESFDDLYNNLSLTDIQRATEVKKRIEQSLNDSTVCFIVNDYFSNELVAKVHSSYGDDDAALKATIEASQFSMKILESYYENMNQKNRRDKLFVDFLIHFNDEVSMVYYIDRDSFHPIFCFDKIDLNNSLKFNDRFKEVLLELSRLTIKTEMDEILKSVLPKFDAEEMAPGWYVPDLFTAINYSLFLNSGNEKIEKVCANPTCNQTFSVEIGNNKHKYCSDSCSNCMRQRRHKANKAMRDAQNSALSNS